MVTTEQRKQIRDWVRGNGYTDRALHLVIREAVAYADWYGKTAALSAYCGSHPTNRIIRDYLKSH